MLGHARAEATGADKVKTIRAQAGEATSCIDGGVMASDMGQGDDDTEATDVDPCDPDERADAVGRYVIEDADSGWDMAHIDKMIDIAVNGWVEHKYTPV